MELQNLFEKEPSNITIEPDIPQIPASTIFEPLDHLETSIWWSEFGLSVEQSGEIKPSPILPDSAFGLIPNTDPDKDPFFCFCPKEETNPSNEDSEIDAFARALAQAMPRFWKGK